MMKADGQNEGNAHSLLTSSNWFISIGFGCNVAWVFMCFKSMGLLASYDDGEFLLDSIYLISIATIVLVLFLGALYDHLIARMLNARSSLFVLPLGMTLFTALISLSGFGGTHGALVVVVSGIGSAIFSGLFLFHVGQVIYDLDEDSMIIDVAIGCIFSSLFFAIFLPLGPIEATVFASVMPIISAFLLYLGTRNMGDRNQRETRGAAVLHSSSQQITGSASTEFSSDESRRLWVRLLIKLCACSILVCLADETSRTLYVQIGIVDSGGTFYAFIQALAVVGATSIIVPIALILLRRRTARMVRICYQMIVFVLMVGLLLLPVTMLYPEVSVVIPYAISSAGYSCFAMFMWIVVTTFTRRYVDMRIRVFGFWRASWAFGALVGMLFGRFVLHVLGLTLEAILPVMVIVALVLLISTTLFSGFDLAEALEIPTRDNVNPIDNTDDLINEPRQQGYFRKKCEQVIATYRLSEREGEVMILLAKGRNRPYIEKELVLSRSTVSTHRQHIYQKLGIHSQQELINLIQNTKID